MKIKHLSIFPTPVLERGNPVLFEAHSIESLRSPVFLINSPLYVQIHLKRSSVFPFLRVIILPPKKLLLFFKVAQKL